MKEQKHGTFNSYINNDCRCVDCKIAAKTYRKEHYSEYVKKYLEANKEKRYSRRREWYQENKPRMKKYRDDLLLHRNNFLATLKNVPCMECGNKYPPYVMDFDHREPQEKEFTISGKKIQLPISKLLEEIEKCDVVCANCHRIRTHNRRINT